MVTEQDKTLAGIQIAIQIEIDGKEYYRQASQTSSNELGRKLLLALSGEEDFHRQKFVRIYDTIRDQKAWPVIIIPLDRSKGLRTVFTEASKELTPNLKVLSTELGAIVKAMEMENKSYDFYQSQGEKASYDAERNFYQSIAAEERGHHRLLLDYYEYIKDPAGWFVQKEHPSLDGG
ncbi:MAG: ferritin family protein [Chloroflexi bacterium]|nr:ferritin family protein [Chloroflexota bacterium]